MALTVFDFLIILLAVITIPIHLAVIFLIVTNLRDKLIRNMYFMLVVSQSCIDIFCILCQLAFNVAPHIDMISNFYWDSRRSSLPAWGYIHIYFFLLARSIGIILICLQRCLSIGYPFSYLNMWVNSTPGICVILFHFTLSVLLPLPVVYNQRGFEFLDVHLEYKMSSVMAQIMSLNRIFSAIVVIIAATISIIAIGISFFHTTKKSDRGIRLKIDNCILKIVTVYLVGFVFLAMYVVVMAFFRLFNIESKPEGEPFYSLITVLFSCLQTWLLVLVLPFFRYHIFYCSPPPRPIRDHSAKVIPIT